MSKRARHAQTGRFVCSVRAPSGRSKWTLGEDAQEALAPHVFTGAMRLLLHMPDATMHAQVSVPAHVRRASEVCKAWRRAFAEWVPRGLAGASAQAWAWAIREGLDKCQYSAYVQHSVPGVPYLPVGYFLPAQTKVEWTLFLHGRTLGTLTLTRRFRAAEGAEDVEHWLQVVYAPTRAPRAQIAGWRNPPASVTVEVLIPHANWAEDNGWRSEAGETAVEQWTREKTVWLKEWVRLMHAELTRDWRVVRGREYYWG